MNLTVASKATTKDRRLYLNDFAGLGSACLAVPVLRASEAASPGMKYSYPSNPLSRDPHLERMLDLRGLIAWHPESWRQFRIEDWPDIAAHLRHHRFDAVVNFRNPDMRQDPLYEQFRDWCRGQSLRMRWYDYYNWPDSHLRDQHVQDRMVKLLELAGVATAPLDPAWLCSENISGGAGSEESPVGIFPSAGTKVKRWPIRNWIVLARRLLAEHRCVEIISGASAEERAEALELFDTVRDEADLASVNFLTTRSIYELLNGLRALALLVTNDTGVAHLANATRIPTLTVFLATESNVWGPRSDWACTFQSQVGRTCILQRVRQGNCERHYGECDSPCHEGVLPNDVWPTLKDAVVSPRRGLKDRPMVAAL